MGNGPAVGRTRSARVGRERRRDRGATAPTKSLAAPAPSVGLASSPAAGPGVIAMLMAEATAFLDAGWRPDLARETASRILELDPGNAAAATLRDLCDALIAGSSASPELLERAAARLPACGTCRRLWAESLLDMDRAAEALTELIVAQVLVPKDVATTAALGLAYSRLGQPDLAATAFASATKREPRLVGLRRGPIRMALAAGRFDEAVRRYRDDLMVDGVDPDTRLIAAGPFESVKAWCLGHSAPYRTVAAHEADVIHLPRYAGDPPAPPLPTTRPETYVAEIADATVVGGESLILAPGGAIVWDVGARASLDRVDLIERTLRFAEPGSGLVDAAAPRGAPVASAIGLAGVSSDNYYHWLFEFLARFAVLEASGRAAELADVPLLVDRATLAVPQLVDALVAVAGVGHPVIPLEPGVARAVERLTVVSPLAWMANNLRDGEEVRPSDYFVASEAIRFLRGRLAHPSAGARASVGPGGSGGRRIYLAKKHGRTRLVNGADLVPVFERFGIETVYPASLSLDEQIDLFGSAALVVSETGAALTNLMFCRPGTQVVIFMSAPRNAAWFSQIAGVAGLDATFIAGRPVRHAPKIYQSPFRLDPQVLEGALRRLRAEASDA